MTERPSVPVLSRPPDDDAALDAWAENFAAMLLNSREVATDAALDQGDED